MKRLGDSLTDEQFAWARKVERELGITISQAVKAIERNDREKIAEWKRQLAAKKGG